MAKLLCVDHSHFTREDNIEFVVGCVAFFEDKVVSVAFFVFKGFADIEDLVHVHFGKVLGKKVLKRTETLDLFIDDLK